MSDLVSEEEKEEDDSEALTPVMRSSKHNFSDTSPAKSVPLSPHAHPWNPDVSIPASTGSSPGSSPPRPTSKRISPFKASPNHEKPAVNDYGYGAGGANVNTNSSASDLSFSKDEDDDDILSTCLEVKNSMGSPYISPGSRARASPKKSPTWTSKEKDSKTFSPTLDVSVLDEDVEEDMDFEIGSDASGSEDGSYDYDSGASAKKDAKDANEEKAEDKTDPRRINVSSGLSGPQEESVGTKSTKSSAVTTRSSAKWNYAEPTNDDDEDYDFGGDDMVSGSGSGSQSGDIVETMDLELEKNFPGSTRLSQSGGSARSSTSNSPSKDAPSGYGAKKSTPVSNNFFSSSNSPKTENKLASENFPSEPEDDIYDDFDLDAEDIIDGDLNR